MCDVGGVLDEALYMALYVLYNYCSTPQELNYRHTCITYKL